MEAGERRVEIKFNFALAPTSDEAEKIEHGDSCSPNSFTEKFSTAQACLQRELDACLLTRDEAVALEAGDQQVHREIEVSHWETIRDDPADDVAKGRWPLLGAVEIMARVICAMPGSDTIGTIGEFMSDQFRAALGVPQGLGHEPLGLEPPSH
jgi:hypothetical protein